MPKGSHDGGLAVLVGAGPGDVELLTIGAVQWLTRADVVLYDRLANPAILLDIAPQAEHIAVGKTPGGSSVSQDEINRLLVEQVRMGRLVVRLKGGDPLVFGRGSEEADALAQAGLRFRIVPGISAALGAGAYAGIPLTDRRHASSVAFVTGHEDPMRADSRLDFAALAGIDTLVFYMGVGQLPSLAERLIAAGRPADTPVALVANATRPRQRTVRGTLGTIADIAAAEGVRPPALVIIGAVTEMADRLGWFERLPLHGRRVLVTRARAQASELAVGLAMQGAEVLEAPTIEIAPPEDVAELDTALNTIWQNDWIVFTSPNGVVAGLGRMLDLGLDMRQFSESQIAAIGPATEDRLREFGLLADLVPAEHTSEALAEELLRASVEDTRFLLLRSDLADGKLPRALRSAGADVQDVPAYRTVRPEAMDPAVLAALAEGAVDWITFTSSSTVHNLLAFVDVEQLGDIRLAAIGPVTARTLHDVGLEPTVVATPHTIDALVDAILQAEQ